MNDQTRPFPPTLARQAPAQPEAESAADAALAVWREVFAALAPVIGTGGVSALLRRSVHLRQADLPGLTMSAREAGDLGALHAALLAQTPATAQAAHDALLETFVDLLATLIGPALTERLTGFARTSASSGTATQDKQP
jgi:hypothetical protein